MVIFIINRHLFPLNEFSAGDRIPADAQEIKVAQAKDDNLIEQDMSFCLFLPAVWARARSLEAAGSETTPGV